VIAKRRAGFDSPLSPQAETASRGALSATAMSAEGKAVEALSTVDETVDIASSSVD
jgi:hypothetical protein